MGGDQANWTGAGDWSRSSGGEKRERGGEERGGELHSDLSFSKFFKMNISKSEQIKFRAWRCLRESVRREIDVLVVWDD